MNVAKREITDAGDLFQGFIEELEDGVDVELERGGDATILDFLRGDADTLPIKLRIKIDE